MYGYNYSIRRHRNSIGERNPSVVNAYDNTIRHADRFLKQLWDTLEKEGYGDALFVVHSDHGDEVEEHANYGHRPLMYDTVTRVPLAIGSIDQSGSARVQLAARPRERGAGHCGYRRATGRQLLGPLRQSGHYHHTEPVLGRPRRTAAAVGPEWKVLFHPEGEWGHGMNFEGESQEAYHLPSDPRKQNDRCGDHPDKLEERLRTQLTEDVETDAGSGEVTGQARERIRELGYIK